MVGERLRIRDLPGPVVAAKSNWDVADVSLDFTPRNSDHTRMTQLFASHLSRQEFCRGRSRPTSRSSSRI
jgi:hypothetical protein